MVKVNIKINEVIYQDISQNIKATYIYQDTKVKRKDAMVYLENKGIQLERIVSILLVEKEIEIEEQDLLDQLKLNGGY